MDIYCKVTELGLIPMYDSDWDNKHKLKLGDTVVCRIVKPRNYEFHKKFFALLRLTVENLPEHIERETNIHTEEDMLTALKLDLGAATVIEYNGRLVVKEESISFAKMDHYAFERFFNRCVDVILGKYLRGTNREDLLAEIANFK